MLCPLICEVSNCTTAIVASALSFITRGGLRFNPMKIGVGVGVGVASGFGAGYQILNLEHATFHYVFG